MGNMIGSGVFLLPASLAPYGWNAVLGWIVTIAGTLVLAWVFAALTKALPEARDPTGFVTEAFGELPAFVVAWLYLVSIWSAVASISMAGVSYLSSLVPVISATPFLPSLCAMLLVWTMTVVNLRGVHSAGRFQILTVALKLVPLLGVIGLAALVLSQGSGEIRPFVASDIDTGQLGGAAALTLFALLGFECASVAAGKVENPAVIVPRATLWGTALTGLVYLLVCSAVALMLPEAVAAASPAPLATFVEIYWNTGTGQLLSLFAIVSCVGAVNGWVLMQGELPRSMAERGILPGWFAVTDGRGTPWRSLLMSGAIASVFLVFTASRSMQGIYEFLLLLSTSSTLWLYLLCALAAVRMKVVRGLALAGAAYALWTLWGAGLEATGWSVVLAVAGVPLYLWTRRVQPHAA